MKLTPQEKAEELINDFMEYSDSADEYGFAKKCALRCVNEILENFGTITQGKDHFAAYLTIQYYEEVKKEILKHSSNK
jgi:hypothetical protein